MHAVENSLHQMQLAATWRRQVSDKRLEPHVLMLTSQSLARLTN